MTNQGPDDSVADADPSGDDRRYADLRADFGELGSGHHVALFYDSLAAQRRVAAAFVASALDRNQRCLYLTDRNEPEAIRETFRRDGVDVTSRVDAGDLEIRAAAEVYLDAEFDPDRIIDTLGAASEASVEGGYDGFAAVGENSWSFRTEVDFDDIVEFEAMFDAHDPEHPVTTLCQYGLDDFDETAIAKALRTHEHVVYRDTLCRNPYYLPPERYADVADAGLNATLMLEQTHGLARSRRAVERHEQRLAVVNRILRHDIRNDLNVVLGTLSQVRERNELDDAGQAQLDRVKRVATRLVDRAQKARYVQQTLGDESVSRFDLDALVADAAATVRGRRPDATIAVEGATDATVLADGHLKTAVVELLTNAVVHGTDEPPSVTVRLSRDGATAVVDVANSGPPVPVADRRALEQGIETPLEHAGGLGLWLVKWIADNSRGSLRFPETDPGTCRITLDLRVVD
jgi:signal transduction histidine kinase